MPNGRLSLQVIDVYGQPIAETVDVLMKNQTLSDAPVFRDLDGSVTQILTGLNVFPNGRYRLEADSLPYHPVSRFINIPANGNGQLVLTLPVNPKKVVSVDFPAYKAPSIPADAWKLLEQTSNMLGFENQTAEPLYRALDDVRRAGFLNLIAKADRTRFRAAQNIPSVLSFIQEIRELRGDRFFSLVPRELRSMTINSMADGLFHEVSEALHTPPPEYEKDRSFKTQDHYGNLQLSFFSGANGTFAMDMDIDDAQGFEHIFQVVGNFFGGPTHPYNIHEILIAAQELDPGYRLLVRQPIVFAVAAKPSPKKRTKKRSSG